MDEILRNLPSGARVLDLGCRDGSFPASSYPDLKVIRLDRDPPPGGVQADAARLPFPDRTFDTIISNHSLEHMDDLDSVLHEIGRVARSGSSLYVAVPDASTFSDRLYRWIYHGGGHVNPFCDQTDLAMRITRATGLGLVARHTLHSSFDFLGRHNFGSRPPRRMWLFANGDERVIVALSWLARLAGVSHYGWALYFGSIPEVIETRAWTNVCVHCGCGHPVEILKVQGLWYSCQQCGTRNLFTPDRA